MIIKPRGRAGSVARFFQIALLATQFLCYIASMRQLWRDIQTNFSNEHVIIVNPETMSDQPSQLAAGEVIDHDPLLDPLLDRCNLAQFDSYAIKYTGDLGRAIGERGMVRVIEHD